LGDRNTTIPCVGGRADRLVIRRDLDLGRLSLTPEEGFVLSRADGCGSVGELLAVAGLPEAQAVGVLRSLCEKGILFAEAGTEAKGKGSANGVAPRASAGARPLPPFGAKGRYDGFIFSPADLAEPVDLSKDVCKELLFLDASLGKLNLYDLLGVRPGTSAEQMRKRYHELSRIFHPDRYYGKKLGSHGPRMSRVFQAVTRAFETLSDPARKAEYDRKTDVPLTEEELAAAAAEQAARQRDEQRTAERRERLRRRNPLMRQHAKVKGFVEQAERAESREDWRQAANLYRLALGHSPGDAALEARLAEVDGKAAALRAEDLVQKAEAASVLGDHDRALAMLEEAIGLVPKHLGAHLARGSLLAARGAPTDEVLEAARQAVASDRKSARAWMMYGRALLKDGNKKEAKTAFTRALEINPKSEDAQEALKKLRWTIF
jgi:curved DNA-binding protein CbpA